MKVAFNCVICQNGIADTEMYLETPLSSIGLKKPSKWLLKFGSRINGDEVNVTSNQRVQLDYAVLPNTRLSWLLISEKHMRISTYLISNISFYRRVSFRFFQSKWKRQ
jgi:hypothetical protein